MTRQESRLQQMTCEYLSLNNIFYFSIPNEHWNISFAELNALKKRGMVPGMPDLAILKNQKIYFLEFKSKRGKLSKNQQIIIDYLIANTVVSTTVVLPLTGVATILAPTPGGPAPCTGSGSGTGTGTIS